MSTRTLIGVNSTSLFSKLALRFWSRNKRYGVDDDFPVPEFFDFSFSELFDSIESPDKFSLFGFLSVLLEISDFGFFSFWDFLVWSDFRFSILFSAHSLDGTNIWKLSGIGSSVLDTLIGRSSSSWLPKVNPGDLGSLLTGWSEKCSWKDARRNSNVEEKFIQ